MRSVYELRLSEQTEMQRTIEQGDARTCSPTFGRVCKAIWPVKTAEHLAFATGRSVRAAAYEISGEREPSPLAILVVNQEMLRPWIRTATSQS